MNIPGYRIEREIGKGGMATVYLAIQELLDRKVALKVMNPSLAADETFCTRFLKEGKTIAQFKHPNIVTIYDIGCFESYYYMAMEYISGGTLKQRIRQGSALEQPVAILRQIAVALGYAHARGFIHRDIKPANILFQEEGSAVLSDFGIAKDITSDEQLTRMGFAIGTPEYMSPEQALGHAVDGRSDLYSLGVVFYEMLVGHKPFVASDAFAVALMHVKQPVPLLPEAFTVYQPVVDRLLAKNPRDRFHSAEELVAALDSAETAATVASAASRAQVTAPGSKRAAESGERPPALLRRVNWKWGMPVALMATLGGGAVYFYSTFAPDEGGVSRPAETESRDRSRGLSPADQAKVDRLLGVAEAHAAIGRLIEPPGSNAYDAYKLVLQIDPDNARAKAGLRRIERETQSTGR